MATRTWNGSNDSFSNAAAWSPTGVPTSGDIAIINSGTVSLAGSLSGVALKVNEALGSAASTTLALSSATVAANSPLTVNNLNSFNAAPLNISTSGSSVFAATGSFYGNGAGTQIQLAIAAGSTLANTGTMNFYATSPRINGGGTFENDGTVALVNPGSVAQIPIVADAVTGTGTFALGAHARIAFSGPVASTQTVLLNDGSSGSETLELDQPSTFKAAVNGFSPSDLIAVVNTPFTSATYTSTSANSGFLSLFSNGTPEGTISFLGQYALSSFTLKFNDFGGGLSNLQITTSVVNNQSGGLPAGFNNGGNGALPVYRFFDKVFGTHFFTSDIGERNTTLALSNYTEETNNFGDVIQDDPNSKPVFRFFDTKFGTHFFTANAAERDNAINTRPDLIYEPNSTFYEHGTQQGGDVAVYRLFDTQFGTHFYTGDQNEYNNITTAGNPSFRSNLTPEGIEFYAPSGSFT